MQQLYIELMTPTIISIVATAERFSCRNCQKRLAISTLFVKYTHARTHARTHIHTHTRYQKGKINQDFTEARDSEWQWHQLGHMQVCTSLQTDNHASTPPLSFSQAGCPFCCPTNSVKAPKAIRFFIKYVVRNLLCH